MRICRFVTVAAAVNSFIVHQAMSAKVYHCSGEHIGMDAHRSACIKYIQIYPLRVWPWWEIVEFVFFCQCSANTRQGVSLRNIKDHRSNWFYFFVICLRFYYESQSEWRFSALAVCDTFLYYFNVWQNESKVYNHFDMLHWPLRQQSSNFRNDQPSFRLLNWQNISFLLLFQ